MKKAPLLALSASFLISSAALAPAAGVASTGGGATGTEVSGRLSDVAHPTPKKTGEAAAIETSLALDAAGKKSATTFSPATPAIYLVTKNIAGAKDDTVRAVWVADDTGKVLPKGKKLTDTAMKLPDAKSYNPTFNQPAPLKGKFPPGKYHVELSVGTKRIASLPFTVK